MKRISLVLVSLFLVNALAMAQITDFMQQGRATQELRSDGFVIAHPSLPLNSRVTLTNINTGKEVEAIVISRITPSHARIADLSPQTWRELGLAPGSEIRITMSANARPWPAASAPHAEEVVIYVERPAAVEPPPPQPVLIIEEPQFDLPQIVEELVFYEPEPVAEIALIEPEPVIPVAAPPPPLPAPPTCSS